MKRTWKGREAVTPEVTGVFEEWEKGAWRSQLVARYGEDWTARLELLAFDRTNEVVTLDLGHSISSNWPLRESAFLVECASALGLGGAKERMLRIDFESVVASLSQDARRLVDHTRRSMKG